MRTTPRLVVVALLCTALVSSAQIVVGMALTELSNAATNVQTALTNAMADAINQRNYNRMLDLHIAQTREVRSIRTRFDKLVGDIDREVAGFESSRGSDPSTWGTDAESEKARARHAELKSQRAQVVRVRDEQLARLQEGLNGFFRAIRSIEAADMERLGQQLINHQRALSQQAAGLAQAIGGISAAQQATGAVKPIKLKADGRGIAYIVNNVRVEPGAEAQVPMPADRVLRIRAEAVTEQRRFNLTKAPQRNTTIDQRSPWVFQFTVDTGGAGGQTTWQVAKEEYEWTFPGNPKVPSEHSVASSGVFPTVKNDVFVWNVPRFFESRFGKGWYETFWIASRGSVDWSYERRGMGGVGSKSDKKTERFDSGLEVRVGAE